MKLERLALVSDVVAGVAIVITLIILIIQLRGNTEAVSAATYQNVADSITSIPAAIAADRQLTRIFFGGLRAELDDPLDSQQFSILALMQVRRFENAFHQRERMEPAQWVGIRNSIATFSAGPGFGVWWSSNRESFTVEFREFLDDLRADQAKSAATN